MTPNNIVNMSIIKGLDIIAVTDHNSCGNVEAVMKAAGDKILVVPAMEVETSEEIHMACYFRSLEDAKEAEKILKKNMTGIKNKTHIYGHQYFMDENDEITGEEENLLVTSTKLSIYEVFDMVNSFGGAAVPAHIDRTSYSVLSNLGIMPDDINFASVEITPKNRKSMEEEYSGYNIISSSDAHYLENISEMEYKFELEMKSAENVIDFLCKSKKKIL